MTLDGDAPVDRDVDPGFDPGVDASPAAATDVSGAALLDPDCSPTKMCRNMQGITFDGFADEGVDIRDAWRDRLQREGKLAAGGASLRDLVLGSAVPAASPGAD